MATTFTTMLAAVDFHSISLHAFTVRAERVEGSTPSARVTWSTTVPECVAQSITVEFSYSSRRDIWSSYTTTNASETAFTVLTGTVQTGLQCAAYYYVRVIVTGVFSLGTLSSRQVPVIVGGEVMHSMCNNVMNIYHSNLRLKLHCILCHFTDISTPVRVRGEVTADNTSIGVLWEWSRQDLLLCLDSIRVDYRPEGGSPMMYTVDNATATSATLSNLQCNTQYFITVHARGGVLTKSSTTLVVSVPARGNVTGV